MGWKKAVLVLAVLLVIVVAGVFSYLYISKPVSLPELDSRSTELFAALYSGGIDDALVDVTDSSVQVAYELPAGMGTDVSAYFTFGAAARVSPVSKSVVVTVFENQKPSAKFSASMPDILSLLDKKHSSAEFSKKVKTEKLRDFQLLGAQFRCFSSCSWSCWRVPRWWVYNLHSLQLFSSVRHPWAPGCWFPFMISPVQYSRHMQGFLIPRKNHWPFASFMQSYSTPFSLPQIPNPFRHPAKLLRRI